MAINITNKTISTVVIERGKGQKGDAGYTPIKGVDYFDGENAYDQAVGSGYENTETNFNLRLAEIDKIANVPNDTNSELLESNNNINTRSINVLNPPNGLAPAVGDGVTDDTVALQNILNSMSAGDSVDFPKRLFLTTGTLQIKREIKMTMKGYILADHSNVALLVKNDEAKGNLGANHVNHYSLDIELNIIRVSGKNYETQATSIGVEIWNSFYGKINLKSILNNYIGVKLVGERYGTGYSGVTYNNFTIGYMRSNAVNILGIAKGSDGYITQNQFYSGSLSMPSNDPLTPTHLILDNQGTSVINENTFVGVAFEGSAKKGIIFNSALSNKFISCRFELPNADYLFEFNTSRFNQFIGCGTVNTYMYSNKFIDNPIGNASETLIEWIEYRLGFVRYFDKKYYITPLKNKNGVNGTSNNGLSVSLIPAHWDVEIIKDGSTDYYSSVATSVITDSKVHYNLKYGDNYVMVFGGGDPVNGFMFTNPPSHSKDFLITLRYSQIPYSLSVNSDFDAIIDLSGNNLTIPTGAILVRGHYNYLRNRVYIESIK
ncbi:MAG: hypothetical protein CVU90_15110 [Firmicutes bacterium HGW-Firmicutes-15]|jgi:hypothetical protein|nr:MAG: hypothetical protein CVU90_15110 [Firmicutes bacterium HGW-Firmicutes-15]